MKLAFVFVVPDGKGCDDGRVNDITMSTHNSGGERGSGWSERGSSLGSRGVAIMSFMARLFDAATRHSIKVLFPDCSIPSFGIIS